MLLRIISRTYLYGVTNGMFMNDFETRQFQKAQKPVIPSVVIVTRKTPDTVGAPGG